MGPQPVEPPEQMRNRFLTFRQPGGVRVHWELDGSMGGLNTTGEPFAPTSGYEVNSNGGFVPSLNSKLSTPTGKFERKQEHDVAKA